MQELLTIVAVPAGLLIMVGSFWWPQRFVADLSRAHEIIGMLSWLLFVSVAFHLFG